MNIKYKYTPPKKMSKKERKELEKKVKDDPYC